MAAQGDHAQAPLNSGQHIHVEGAARERKDREVMICVDASEHAERAFDWYVQNIHRPENDVIVLNIAEPPNLTAYVGFGAAFAFPQEEWKRIRAEHEEEVKQLQKKYETKMRSNHMHGKIVVYSAEGPGPCLCEYAKKNNIELIIAGSRGAGVIRRTFMGSISDYILHHAHVPVLVVPPEDRHAHHK